MRISAGASALEEEDVFGEAVAFFGVVGDEEDGDGPHGHEFEERGVEVLLERLVQVGKRFVEEEDVRLGGESAHQGDALPFSSGKGVRLSPQEGRKARDFEEGADLRVVGPDAPADPVRDVLPHGHVRKEEPGLKHVADAPHFRRQGLRALPHEHPLAEADRPPVGEEETGDQVEECGLPRAGGAKDGRDPRRKRVAYGEGKLRETLFHVHVEHGSPPRKGRSARGHPVERKGVPCRRVSHWMPRRVAMLKVKRRPVITAATSFSPFATAK